MESWSQYRRPLGQKVPRWGCRGAGAPPPEGGVKSPTLGIELGAEGAGAKRRRTSDGRVYSCPPSSHSRGHLVRQKRR
jgi:hypothetical protein